MPFIWVLRIKQSWEVVGDVSEFVCCAYISKFLYYPFISYLLVHINKSPFLANK
jgi:hypothetical protein